jgi:hypothetical protein
MWISPQDGRKRQALACSDWLSDCLRLNADPPLVLTAAQDSS